MLDEISENFRQLYLKSLTQDTLNASQDFFMFTI